MADEWRDVPQRMRRHHFRFTVAAVYQQPSHVRRRPAVRFALVDVASRTHVLYSSVSGAI